MCVTAGCFFRTYKSNYHRFSAPKIVVHAWFERKIIKIIINGSRQRSRQILYFTLHFPKDLFFLANNQDYSREHNQYVRAPSHTAHWVLSTPYPDFLGIFKIIALTTRISRVMWKNEFFRSKNVSAHSSQVGSKRERKEMKIEWERVREC